MVHFWYISIAKILATLVLTRVASRGGSGLHFTGSGRPRVETVGLGLFRASYMFNKPSSEPVGPEQNKLEPVGPEQNKLEPVGPGPKIRHVGLGLHALFSKKPETEPDLRAYNDI